MAYDAFSRSALRQKKRLLRPLLTSRSGWRRRPFRHKARSPQVRTQSFTTQPPDLHSLILEHKSFAVLCPLALIGFAFYPVLVHRLMASIHASSPHWSPSCSCASLRSLWSAYGGTFTHKIAPMLGAHKKGRPKSPFFYRKSELSSVFPLVQHAAGHPGWWLLERHQLLACRAGSG